MVANKLVEVQVADALLNPKAFDDTVRADDTALRFALGELVL